MTTQAEYFGRAVACERLERGKKRADLKERAGISYAYLAEIENGTKSPSLRVIQALAAALDLKASQLLARAEQIEAMCLQRDEHVV
jgi:transcriptional regulator with XRE-family HTH domain